jgi:hypothetical protein
VDRADADLDLPTIGVVPRELELGREDLEQVLFTAERQIEVLE